MISAAHIHLMMNHLPLFGMFFGVVLLVVYFFRQNLQPILHVALVTILLSGLSAVPTFYSGEAAEEAMENQAHVSETSIHEHEEASEVTVWVSVAAGVLSFLSLLSIYFRNVPLTKRLCFLTLLNSVVATGFAARTANLGGKISHPELRNTDKSDPQQIKNEYEHNENNEREQ